MKIIPYASLLLALLGSAAFAQAPAALTTSAPSSAASPIPIRDAHPVTLRADAGWNSLSGLGLRGSYMATSHLALEAGAGYVLAGPKAGARVRWNFTTTDLTPYVAVGGLWSGGHSAPVMLNQGKQDEFSFHVGQAAYLQSVVGMDFQDRGHLTYGFEIGWAQALNRRDVRVVSGTPADMDWNFVKAVAGGGLVLAGSVGYAF